MFDINNLVSIIVPVYNAEKYLDRCINSVLSQTYDTFELILINDGSIDKSLELCKDYSKNDMRVRVLNKNNGGVSSARNLGLENAKGEFVLFLDADDYIHSSMLEKMIEHMDESDISLVMCGYKQLDAQDIQFGEVSLVRQSKKYCVKSEFFEVLEKNWAPWGKLYRKSFIHEIRFDENLAIAEDLKFNVDVLCKCCNFEAIVIPECLYNYVVNCDSAMNQTYSYKVLDALRAEEDVLVQLLDSGIREDAINRILIGGVLFFFDRYSRMNLAERDENQADYRIACAIINRNKGYILKKGNKTIKEKVLIYMICYFPCLSIYLMRMLRTLKSLRS